MLLIFEALCALCVYDVLDHLGFSAIHTCIRRCPVVGSGGAPTIIPRVCRAVDEAGMWYVKRTYCLQRSAVTTILLRLHGVDARLVIGFRPVPMESHAWVEVEGAVVNDRPQYQKFFQVLDRI